MITLKTLPQATRQEVFDQVVQHLLTQREACIAKSGCYYRYQKDDGKVLKCAAGCLIADDEYVKSMDESDDFNTSWGNLVEKELVPGQHKDLIEDLQMLHDTQAPDEWENLLQKMAFKQELNFNPPPPNYIPDGTQLQLF